MLESYFVQEKLFLAFYFSILHPSANQEPLPKRKRSLMKIVPTIQTIEITLVVDPRSKVRTSDRERRKRINHLTGSMTELSQMTPIVVRSVNNSDTYTLFDGADRLLAAKEGHLPTLLAHVFPEGTSDQHIRRCLLESEFLKRKDSWAIECLNLQELKKLHEECYPETKKGKGKRGKKRDLNAVPAFVSYIARESNQKKSTIFEMLTLAKDLDEIVLKKIDEYKLHKQVGKDLREHKSADYQLALIEKIHQIQTAPGKGRKSEVTVAAADHYLKKEKVVQSCAEIHLDENDADVLHEKMENCKKIAPKSIDCVITDPLYFEKDIDLYSAAAAMSAQVLKNGGFAAFYCGKLHRREVERRLDEHLQFRALITLKHKNPFGIIGSTKHASDCKYILIYQTKGIETEFNCTLNGVIEGSGAMKKNHIYEQNVKDLDNIIDALTKPGDVILDMFAGSGTTGVAAILKSRRTILIEEDEEDCETCRKRLDAAIKERDQILLNKNADHINDGADELRKAI
jgi:DNA modification methylase